MEKKIFPGLKMVISKTMSKTSDCYKDFQNIKVCINQLLLEDQKTQSKTVSIFVYVREAVEHRVNGESD